MLSISCQLSGDAWFKAVWHIPSAGVGIRAPWRGNRIGIPKCEEEAEEEEEGEGDDEEEREEEEAESLHLFIFALLF